MRGHIVRPRCDAGLGRGHDGDCRLAAVGVIAERGDGSPSLGSSFLAFTRACAASGLSKFR